MTDKPLTEAKCPKCGRKTATPWGDGDDFYCHRCKMAFSPIDDGEVGYGPPSRRVERKEQRQKPKQKRR